MRDRGMLSRIFSGLGLIFLAIGIGVFAVRLLHAGPYAMPHGGPLYGALGAFLIGGILMWGRLRLLQWGAILVSPLVLFSAIYSIAGEAEEVISLYAKDAQNNTVNLRLWIVDREDGAWVGMSKEKAVTFGLDGARLEMLRAGQITCVTPVLFEDRDTVRAIHAMKVEKYVVAQTAGAMGLYPLEAPLTAAALRMDSCTE